MTIINHRQAVPDAIRDSPSLFATFVGETVHKLVRESVTKFDTEIDLSTLRVTTQRDSLGLSLKASALELVTVGSRWIRNGAPVSKQGPFKVLTIDHRVDQTYPWLTVEDGWCGRLDYFHRDYTRYSDPATPKPGSYWIMTAAIAVGTKWRCVSAVSDDVIMVAVTGDADTWTGTVAEFNNSFREATD